MGRRMLQLLLLQLDLLTRRGDVHQPPADLGDLIEHLLIGQIKHLVRLLGGIERLVGLGLHYLVGPLEKAHPGCSSPMMDRPRRNPLPDRSGSMPALMPTPIPRRYRRGRPGRRAPRAQPPSRPVM